MAFDPGTLNPHVWLDASKETFNNNDAVGTATDKSGNGRNATQATAGNKPTFKTNIINGQPTFYFATDDWLEWGDVFTGMTAAEVFIVMKRDLDPPVNSPGNASTDAGFWRMNSAVGAGSGSHVPWVDAFIYDGCFCSVRRNVGDPTPSLASPRVYNVISTGSEWTANLDGSQIATYGTNTVSPPSTGNEGMATLGRSSNSLSIVYYYTGHFAELLIFPSKLSTSNHNLVGGYIQNKYGITVAGATFPPILQFDEGEYIAPTQQDFGVITVWAG